MAGGSSILLVDGYNVLHAGILRGRDRAGWRSVGARSRLVAQVAGFTDDRFSEIWVVFDGAGGTVAEKEMSGSRLRVAYSPSADEWILDRIREAAGKRPIAVVTSDRELRRRAKELGAALVSPRAFLAACAGQLPSES